MKKEIFLSYFDKDTSNQKRAEVILKKALANEIFSEAEYLDYTRCLYGGELWPEELGLLEALARKGWFVCGRTHGSRLTREDSGWTFPKFTCWQEWAREAEELSLQFRGR